MSSKITVGLNRKVGQPNYGSLGASCHIDLEVDTQSVLSGGQEMIDRIRRSFELCNAEVERELTRQSQPTAAAAQQHHQAPPAAKPEAPASSSSPRPATPAQLRAIHAIAAKGKLKLADHLTDFGVAAPDGLDLRQASQLIDRLKSRLATAG